MYVCLHLMDLGVWLGLVWHFVVCFLLVYWFFVAPFLTSLGDLFYLYYFIFISLRDLTYSSWCVFSYCSRNYFMGNAEWKYRVWTTGPIIIWFLQLYFLSIIIRFYILELFFLFFYFSMNAYGHPILLQPSIPYLFAIFFYIFIIYKNTDSGLDASLMIQW